MINPKKAEFALEKCNNGNDFEKWSQIVMASVLGVSFKPLGGNKDGGADGFLSDPISEISDKPERFFQASIEVNLEKKIASTVKTLRDNGRIVSRLFYATSQAIKNIDKLQNTLGDELDVVLTIYDRNYLAAHVNDDGNIIAGFKQYIEPSLRFLEEFLGPDFPTRIPFENAKTVCAFLSQEVENSMGNVKTLEAISDALTLWALEGTDPAAAKFMTKDEIITKVEKIIPTAKKFYRGNVDYRLSQLTKRVEGERKINVHKGGNYCLPFSTREAIIETTIEDMKLKADATDSIRTRVVSHVNESLSSEHIAEIVELVHSTLEQVFEDQGYEVSLHFLDDNKKGEINSQSVLQKAKENIAALSRQAQTKEKYEEVVRKVFQGIFYSSTEIERAYCGRLARTYMLLFTLKNTPQIIEHFNSMSKRLVLFVGSDLIIRAISEYFLEPEDQMTMNMFSILRNSGAKLLLSELDLEEVHSHLHATDLEYKNWYEKIDNLTTREIASQSDRILIRAYFYAKLNTELPNPPKTWRAYLQCFLTADLMSGKTSPASMKTLRDTLCARLGLEFLTREEMEKGIDAQEYTDLTKKISSLRTRKRPNEALAENDALHILHLHDYRRLNESSNISPYGYLSWWLTQDSVSSRAASMILPKCKGQRYVMRPEFLINFIAYNPTSPEVRHSLKTIFPSLLGIQLGTRLESDMLEKLLTKAKEMEGMDPARAQARAYELSDAIKTQQIEKYIERYEKGEV